MDRCIRTTCKGKEQIKKLHKYPFNTVLKDATLTVISVQNRFIRDDIVAIDVERKTTGNKTPDGKPIPNRSGLLDLIVTLQGDKMRIILGHNVDYTTAYSRSDLRSEEHTSELQSRRDLVCR